MRCPESPRVSLELKIHQIILVNLCFSQWLIDQDRSTEASAVLSKYHANGVDDDPLVRWELAEIKAALEDERANNQTSYLDFVKTAGNRRRLVVILSLCIGSNWVGSGIVS